MRIALLMSTLFSYQVISWHILFDYFISTITKDGHLYMPMENVPSIRNHSKDHHSHFFILVRKYIKEILNFFPN